MKYLLNIALFLLLSSCASSLPFEKEASSSVADTPIEFYSPEYTSIERLRVNQKLKKEVDKWIKYFSTDLKERFETYLSNGEQYRKMVEEILAEHHIPRELYYLPVIESGYVLHARSHMGAGGAWQFMPSTGRNYGLTYDKYIDERRNIFKATQAAAAHLRDLHNIFGSWPLALASYNAGINRITEIIIKGSNREYWKLSEMDLLPKETSEYLPKFLAAVTIGENPEKFGLSVDKKKPKYLEEYVQVAVPNRVWLKELAKIVEIPFGELRELNLEYRRSYIPSHMDEAEITLPKSSLGIFKENEKKILALTKRRRGHKKVADTSSSHYKVRSGDTLSQVAERFNMGLTSLAHLNGLKRRSHLRIGQLLKVNREFSGIYTVRRGDSFHRIARRFNLSISDIKQINGLRSSKIYPGQKIRVSPNQEDFYIVKNGDTLWDIARENGLTIKEVKRLNSLRSGRIFAGQKLILAEDN